MKKFLDKTKVKNVLLFAMCIILLACNQKKTNHYQADNTNNKIKNNGFNLTRTKIPINDSANNLNITCNTVDTIEHNGLSLTQTKIPINDFEGISITKDRFDDYFLFGFEVDKKGLFYFFSGDTELFCFDKFERIFKRKFKELNSCQLHFYENELYVFDEYASNSLFKIKGEKVELVKENILNRNVNSYFFNQNKLYIEYFKDGKITLDVEKDLSFISVNLDNPDTLKIEASIYGNVNKDVYSRNIGTEYLGHWKQYEIILRDSLNTYGHSNYKQWDSYKLIYFLDSKSEFVEEYIINQKILGKSFYQDPQEHIKLRNNKIYMLSHNKDSLIVTELDLNKL